MKSFNKWLTEETLGGGASAGVLEIHSTSVMQAVEYAKNLLGDKYDEIGDFPSNYKFAQKQAGQGFTQRKDMPVITSRDVHEFQNRLQQGFIDLAAPFAPGTDKSKPFPTGLKGTSAKQWLQNGLAKFDGSVSDDRVKVESRRIAVGKLKPIQKQIYVDKSINAMNRDTIVGTKNFLSTQTIYITSSDNYIIDGHHRYLSAMLLSPKMNVQTLAINLPIKVLLPMAIAYGDAVGNKRNK